MIHPTFLKAFAIQSAATKIGVHPDHIFVAHRLEGDGRMGVVIGRVAFPIDVIDIPAEKFSEAWAEAVKEWNQTSQAERQTHVEALAAEIGDVAFVHSLLQAKATIGMSVEEVAQQVPWHAVDGQMSSHDFTEVANDGVSRTYAHRRVPVEVKIEFQMHIAATRRPGFVFVTLCVDGVDVLPELSDLGLDAPAMLRHAVDRAKGGDA